MFFTYGILCRWFMFFMYGIDRSGTGMFFVYGILRRWFLFFTYGIWCRKA